MMGLFQAIDDKQLRLDQPIAVRNQFQSLVDDSTFTLDPKEDGDPELYQAIGSTRTAGGADPADDRPQLEPRDQSPDRADRRLAGPGPDAEPRRLPHQDPARRRGRQGFHRGNQQPRHGRGPADRAGRPGEGRYLQAGLGRQDDRVPQGAGVQREDPRRPARRDRGRPQDGRHHRLPSRRRDRLPAGDEALHPGGPHRGLSRTRRRRTTRSPRSRGWSGRAARISAPGVPPRRRAGSGSIPMDELLRRTAGLARRIPRHASPTAASARRRRSRSCGRPSAVRCRSAARRPWRWSSGSPARRTPG